MNTRQALAVAFLAFAIATPATADPINITNFTAPKSGGVSTDLDAYGGLWAWTSYSPTDPASRTLSVNISNTASDYLQEVNISPLIDITGGNYLRLTGAWNQLGNDGHFTVSLGLGPVATADFTYGQFAGGSHEIYAPLVWNPSRFDNMVNQWQLVGAGSSSSAWGEFQLTNMAVTVTSVPEPSTMVMVGIGLGYAGWAALRRRRSAVT